MAKLEIMGKELKTNDYHQVKKFLDSEGIYFSRFDLTENSKHLAQLSNIPDEQRPNLINEYPEHIDKYSKLSGYRADVICLSPDFEYIDFVLQKFKDIHYHFENEHWYLIDGSCGFAFLGSDGRKFVVEVVAGERITVPEGIWQWLIPPSDKRMKSIRYFNTTHSIPAPKELIFDC